MEWLFHGLGLRFQSIRFDTERWFIFWQWEKFTLLERHKPRFSTAAHFREISAKKWFNSIFTPSISINEDAFLLSVCLKKLIWLFVSKYLCKIYKSSAVSSGCRKANIFATLERVNFIKVILIFWIFDNSFWVHSSNKKSLLMSFIYNNLLKFD